MPLNVKANDNFVSSVTYFNKDIKFSGNLTPTMEGSKVLDTSSYTDSVGNVNKRTYFYAVPFCSNFIYTTVDSYAVEVRVEPYYRTYSGNENVIWSRVSFGTLSDMFGVDAQLGRPLRSDTASVFTFTNNHERIGLYLGLTVYGHYDEISLVNSGVVQNYPNINFTGMFNITVTSYFTEADLNGGVEGAVNSQTVILKEQLETDQKNLEEQQKQTEIMEEQKDELKEQTETQKGILASILDFFGGFFDNLINSILGIFVPSSDEMSSLFDDLNNFFSDTFGFLYYPFEFVIKAFNALASADSSTALSLPSFEIMGYKVWGEQTFDISSLGVASDIFKYVRIGTGSILALAFINYLRNFFDKRFGGGGS